jgi:hypothetical protein
MISVKAKGVRRLEGRRLDLREMRHNRAAVAGARSRNCAVVVTPLVRLVTAIPTNNVFVMLRLAVPSCTQALPSKLAYR